MKFMRSMKMKAFGTALALVACEPISLVPTCQTAAECGKNDYRISLRKVDYPVIHDPTTVLKALPVMIRIEDFKPVMTVGVAGRSGLAYADVACSNTCAPHLKSVLVTFTTDVLTIGGDTLKAGYNFASKTSAQGVKWDVFEGVTLESVGGFRDSVFEIRFSAKANDIQKYDTLRITIRNPDLILKP